MSSRRRRYYFHRLRCLKNGFYGDHAYTFAVGTVDPEVEKLLKVTKASLYEGIRTFKKGNRLGDLGFAIQDFCEKEGYGVVRELVGHGLGSVMHEGPEVPNYGRRGRGKQFVDEIDAGRFPGLIC
jgi:Methionine aminopeptidase